MRQIDQKTNFSFGLTSPRLRSVVKSTFNLHICHFIPLQTLFIYLPTTIEKLASQMSCIEKGLCFMYFPQIKRFHLSLFHSIMMCRCVWDDECLIIFFCLLSTKFSTSWMHKVSCGFVSLLSFVPHATIFIVSNLGFHSNDWGRGCKNGKNRIEQISRNWNWIYVDIR